MRKSGKMRNGEVPIYEPHLDVLFERNIKAGRLKFTTSLDEGFGTWEHHFSGIAYARRGRWLCRLVLRVGGLKPLVKTKTYKVIVDKVPFP